MSVNKKYLGQLSDDEKQKLQEAAQHMQADALIYGTSFTQVCPDFAYVNSAGPYSNTSAKDLHNLYNNLQQQYNQQRMDQLAQEYARWQHEQLRRTQDDAICKHFEHTQQQTAPYTDPPPAVANFPTCPQCSRLLLRTDATWTANHYYWTCIYHGIWRRLDGKLIPPHPDDSDNCGHWTKDSMLWIWERQRWECVGCRNTKTDCPAHK